MADLIEKYFQTDLTAAERVALKEKLASSPEAAQRFGALAEEAYGHFGLPEPQWMGPEKLAKVAKAGFRTGFALGVLVTALLMGFLGWRLFHGSPAQATSPAEGVQPWAGAPWQKSPALPALSITNPNPGSPVKPVSAPPEVQTAAKPLKPLVPVQAAAPLPGSETSGPAPKAASPASAQPPAPVNLATHPDHDYSNLSVVVDWPMRREIRVRVLDGKGGEILPLYRGLLDPGRWAFDWDGKLPDGRLAPAGEYQIEVSSGSMVQKKGIQIK